MGTTLDPNGIDTNYRRLLLVSSPRTASHLLLKILALDDQPDVLTNEDGGYFFHNAFLSAIKNGFQSNPASSWTDQQKEDLEGCFQAGIDNIEKQSKCAQDEGKIMFAKEHAVALMDPRVFAPESLEMTEQRPSMFQLRLPSIHDPAHAIPIKNPTVFPDQYLKTWQMIFLIRHPALAFPSWYRAAVKLADVGYIPSDESIHGVLVANMSLQWTRRMYDWCFEQQKEAPLLLDAHDLIHNPQVVARFCELSGLDPTVVKFEWEESKAEKPSTADNAMSIMLSSLYGSSGPLTTKFPEKIDISLEAQKWKAEFGDEIGHLVEQAVLRGMPDYEYLSARRLTP